MRLCCELGVALISLFAFTNLGGARGHGVFASSPSFYTLPNCLSATIPCVYILVRNKIC